MPDLPPSNQVERFQKELLDWANEGNLREFPWRESESPYEVLVAEILLGATPATKVEGLYEEFLRRYPDLEALAKTDQEDLATLLGPLGLQNRRASAFIQIGRQLSGEGVPDSEEDLLDLPYVGRYAANATLCFGFGQRRPIVDTNVVQVYARAFGVTLDADDPASWEFARQMLPEEEVRTYNLALLDYGALISGPNDPFSDHSSFGDRSSTS